MLGQKTKKGPFSETKRIPNITELAIVSLAKNKFKKNQTLFESPDPRLGPNPHKPVLVGNLPKLQLKPHVQQSCVK